MKKNLLTAMLSATLLFGAAAPAATTYAYPKADFTWQFVRGQTFQVIGKPGTTYEILTPDMTRITSRKGDTVEFFLPRKGDVYILAHQPGEEDFLYHLMVGGEENRTVIEHHVEHIRHHVNLDAMDADVENSETSEQFAREVLDLVNQERRKQGIAPLRLSRELMDAAAIRAEEITQVFSHTRPNGQSCSSLIEQGAYTVGENIAAGTSTPEAVVNQWMNSPGHRANILNKDYTELGVGHEYRRGSEYGHYWVQMFRRPMSRAYRHW